MKQQYEFPRINTRGHYDLWTGKKIKKGFGYSLFPKKKFDKIFDADEIVIFIHGMRNTSYGAKKGGQTLRRRLRQLGFKKHPVVSFSYDANIRGAHKYDDYDRVISVAENIAMANGRHLKQFIDDLRADNPMIKIHLVGHSLGCEVLTSFLMRNIENEIESVHLFGSPVNKDVVHRIAMGTPTVRFVNYVNKKDEDIRAEVNLGRCKEPSCLNKVRGDHWVKVINKSCPAKDHRFKSYAEKLRSFP